MASSLANPVPHPNPEDTPPQAMFSLPKYVVFLLAIVCATKLITHPLLFLGPIPSSGFSSLLRSAIGGNFMPSSCEILLCIFTTSVEIFNFHVILLFGYFLI